MADRTAGAAAIVSELAAYQAETGSSIRLVPTEGLMSPLQKLMYQATQHERYLHAPPEDSDKAIRYPDIGRLQAIYGMCRDSAGRSLGARYVLPDPLSGMQAMTIAILALSQPGDTVASVDPRHGGHESFRPLAGQLGRKSTYLAFDERRHQVLPEVPGAGDAQLIYLDHSNHLFPHDIRAVRWRFPGARIVADLSQVLLFVMAGSYPNPLRDGADVITGSAHKSLCGPQKALIATNSRDAYDRLLAVTRVLVSNNHPAAVAALAVCLEETRLFGAAFARQMTANANALASSLARAGIPVYRSEGAEAFTATQHVWIDCEKIGWSADTACAELARVKIVVNTLYLARGGAAGTGGRGLRLGTTEVTRLGFRQPQMATVGRWIADVLLHRDTTHLAARVERLRGRYSAPRFCLDVADVAHTDRLARLFRVAGTR